MALFGWLASGEQKEPSAPRKIGYGMLVAGIGYVIMIAASIGLENYHCSGFNPLPVMAHGGVAYATISFMQHMNNHLLEGGHRFVSRVKTAQECQGDDGLLVWSHGYRQLPHLPDPCLLVEQHSACSRLGCACRSLSCQLRLYLLCDGKLEKVI